MSRLPPDVIHFEGIGLCFFERVRYGTPKKGEFYLSGAIVEAWRAPAGLHADYFIVKPTFRAKQRTVFVKGEPV